MSVTIDLMNNSGTQSVPGKKEFQHWSNTVFACLEHEGRHCEVGIRLVDETESAELNQNFRQKKGPTNVLSFTYNDIPENSASELLGDLAICTQIVEREAREQNKSAQAHWAHMTVHGLLHLLGYDHQHDAQAETMETLEGVILAKLGYANPYESHTEH
ncbi:MAG: rRNA maturation RNase YbeY [Gammaproteobacteria bacterium]|nr:rRNA maturation RNase YbeY [Gammaproteobacteria bacterium]MAY03545.1 rRNA maturation RNase YbeY [Gammaproteobacteria bacterium]|tara:strand:- start:484 stop:960 length:477 start_codon:yes stop_codon:yes gene_type:complete